MRRTAVFLSLLLVLVLALGCAPKPGPTSTPTATPKPTTPVSTPTTNPTPTTPPAQQPKYGGVLRYFVSVSPPWFDLHTRPSYGPFSLIPLYNNLIAFDPKKPDLNPQNIIPDLAERWEVGNDGKTWTFYLRQGVKWHDGRPFSADDVVYSMEKMVDPKRSTLYNQFPAFRNIEKVDQNTVKVNLKYPSPSFFLNLASPYAVIQPKHLAGTDNKSKAFLVGTGPFKLKNYTEAVILEMEKNPDYFKKGLPYLDGITIHYIDYSTFADVFIAKRVDLSIPGGGLDTKEQFERISKASPEAVLKFVDYPYSRPIHFNVTRDYLKDARVRRALTLLWDPKVAIQSAFGMLELGWTERAVFPSTWEMPKADSWSILMWDKPFEERVAQAKKLMSEAGYAQGFKLKILTKNTSSYERMLNVYADQLRRHLNIDAEIVSRPPPEATKLSVERNFDLYLSDRISAYLGDLDEYTDYFVTNGPGNWGAYSNPALDKLFAEQSWTMDFTARQRLAYEIERVILTDLPIIPTGFFAAYFIAWHPYVKGYVPGLSGYAQAHMRLESVWMDK